MGEGGNIRIGNPAPLGLFAFGITTAMLMIIDSGWVEPEFEQFVASYALFYGGVCQLLVGIFELLKGSSFSFAVFTSYGAFWLGWGLMVFTIPNVNSGFVSTKEYTDGKTAWLVFFGTLTACFYIIILRKNVCLIVTFGLLIITFYMLAAATHSGIKEVKKVAGYFGFATALCAWYTGVAELVNEEYGRMILPGLAPILKPSQLTITMESIASRLSYDSRSNTLFVSFRSLQIKTAEDIAIVKDAMIIAITKAKAPNDKVHVIVDYDNSYIGKDVFEDYWTMVEKLQAEHYLSVSRFHVSSFGTGGDCVELGLRRATPERAFKTAKSIDV